MKSQRLTDALNAYVPVLMLALLAGGTYWLVRSTPNAPEAKPEAAARHVPESIMRDFALRAHATDGQLKHELRGAELRQYKDDRSFEVDAPVMLRQASLGGVQRASAQRAVSNADGSDVQLYGQAVARRDQPGKPSFEIRSDILLVYQPEELVRATRPVVIVRGQDEYSGSAMTYRGLQGTFELQGPARAVWQPKR
jgi:lipopolysaccharide export system protein LptC